MDILLEKLGHTYAPILDDREMEVAVVVGDQIYPVEPVFPYWELNSIHDILPTDLDLGGGPVSVRCCWGLIHPDKDNHLYYRGELCIRLSPGCLQLMGKKPHPVAWFLFETTKNGCISDLLQ